MAVKSNIQFKGFQVNDSYVSYKGHVVEKFSIVLNGAETKGYSVTVNLEIYKDDTKAIYLAQDQISYTTDKDSDLSFTRIWSEVKNKYPGQDVL